MKKIIFAFALSDANLFANTYFGKADKFAIYEYSKNKQLSLKEELPNPIKAIAEDTSTNEKRKLVISSLKSSGVEVLVSRQFSKNLHLVNDDFIPVLIEKENPEQVVEILNKNIKWIKDELKNRNSAHMLFRITTGVLKLAIK